MENLEELYCYSVRINEKKYGKVVGCSIAEETVCFITATNYVYICEQNRLNNLGLACKMTLEKLNHVHFLVTHNVIFVSSNYELVIITRDLQSNVIQPLPWNITQLCWNPAETLLAVISENENIVLYSYSKESMFELKSIVHQNIEVSRSLHVGWGSQETQFLGPRARQVRFKDEAEEVPVEYEPPTISWRANGQHFVVNYFEEGHRYIKVFDNDLNALFKSVKYANLKRPVSTILGQCIACCSVRNEVNNIVIFEKNCQLKSSFEAPNNKYILKERSVLITHAVLEQQLFVFPKDSERTVNRNHGTIEIMQCHPDMNLLAVYSLDEEQIGYINIYLHTNGKWILKQQLYYPQNRKVCGFKWSNTNEPLYTLCRLIVLTSENIESHTFRFIVNRCPNTALVSVVNGRSIDFYNFAEKNTPPPLAIHTVHHVRPIIRLLFHPERLFCIILDSELQIAVIDLQDFQQLLTSDGLDLQNFSCFHSVTWNEQGVTNICISNDKYHYQKMFTHNFPSLNMQVKTVEKLLHGFILPYNDSTSLASYKSFDDIIPKFIYLTKKVLKTKDSEIEFDFALTSNREFYVNDKMVSSGITSCYTFQNYLILTSVTCRLYCMRLEEDYELLYNELDLSQMYSREIEQGARIVCNSTGEPPQIILQLPRGNIESIRCRLITVDVVENLLSNNYWREAVELMRTERLNWNLLVNLNPQRFSQRIVDFVNAAQYCSLLSNIVCDFNNTDNAFGKKCLPPSALNNFDKTKIVKKILDYLIATDSMKNFMTIVLIQQKQVSLKAAVKTIKLVYEENETANKDICKKALRALLVKENLKDVVNAAYCLYDIDFVLFVYQCSIMDPKYYEPIIHKLKQLPAVSLHYEMALSGKDEKNAIKYLLRSKDVTTSKLENFIIKHKLEEVAYNSIQRDNKHYVVVAALYAKKLSRQQSYAEAGLILKKAGLLSDALEEYKKALDWLEVLGLLSSLGYDESKKKDVLNDVADKLVKAHRVDDAVMILQHYNKDSRKAIQILVDQKDFKKAIVLAKMSKDEDVLHKLILPTLNLYMTDLKDKIEEYGTTFNNYVERLSVIRQDRMSKLELASIGMFDENDELFSDIASTISSAGSSRATSRSRGSTFSSKNRRKEEKKKLSLRPGGYYEDIALIRAIHLLYDDVSALGKEVREVSLISEHNNVRMCQNLHEQLSQLQESMLNKIPEIWPDEFVNEPKEMDNKVLAITQNKRDLDPQYTIPPSSKVLRSDWKLKIFSPK